MNSMAQIATTAVQAAPLYIYSFMAIIAFQCLDVLLLAVITYLVVSYGSDFVLINTHMPMERYFSATWGSQIFISLTPRTKLLDDIVDLIDRVAQHPLT